MSELQIELNRSQYSTFDESIEISSISSKNRSNKYFTRRPINTITVVGRKKDRDSNEFSGFYSPIQKHEMKKDLIERAIGKSPPSKMLQLERKQSNAAENAGKEKIGCIVSQQKRINSTKDLDNIFKKKKTAVEQSFSTREMNRNVQNPEAATLEIQQLKIENERLKREILILTDNQKKSQVMNQQFDLLKQYIKQIQLKLEASETHNRMLQDELQDIHLANSSISTLEAIHLDSIKSLNELNYSLKKEVFELQEKMKYAGIEIVMLRMKCPDENMSKIIEERANLKQKNRELKVEIAKLQARLMENELFELSPENTARD